MMRSLSKDEVRDLLGATIKKIDDKSCNVLKITFTNGALLEIIADIDQTPLGRAATLFVQSMPPVVRIVRGKRR